MHISELFNFIGVTSVVLSASCLAIIGIRNSVWYGPPKGLLSELKPIDIKLAKASGLIFINAIIMFIIGALSG